MYIPGQEVRFPGHSGLESEPARPGLQSTLVRMFGTRLSSLVILKEPRFVAIVAFSTAFQ